MQTFDCKRPEAGLDALLLGFEAGAAWIDEEASIGEVATLLGLPEEAEIGVLVSSLPTVGAFLEVWIEWRCDGTTWCPRSLLAHPAFVQGLLWGGHWAVEARPHGGGG